MSTKRVSQFTAVAWKERRHFVSQCLNVDVSSFGKTKREALVHLDEALALYLEDAPRKIPTVQLPTLERRMIPHA
ncbi:MAG: type II toxin-antitoxin system HicB family antitoxin [Candidatus Sungbacteria bacterium]|nr:type II toxin-antitoxin system HicB family antitoxin [Candidatus Sungbacteria bacterium]